MLPSDLKETVTIISQTENLPKNLVYVRQGIDPHVTNMIIEIMTGMHLTEEGQNVLVDMRKTTKFDSIPESSIKDLEELENLLGLVSGE